MNMGKAPPTSIRFCPLCNKNRTFKYDPQIGHSRCVECGAGFAGRAPVASIEKNKLITLLDQRMAKFHQMIESNNQISDGARKTFNGKIDELRWIKAKIK